MIVCVCVCVCDIGERQPEEAAGSFSERADSAVSFLSRLDRSLSSAACSSRYRKKSEEGELSRLLNERDEKISQLMEEGGMVFFICRSLKEWL